MCLLLTSAVLAGCTYVIEQPRATPTAQDAPASKPKTGNPAEPVAIAEPLGLIPEGCATTSMIVYDKDGDGRITAKLLGELVDMGSQQFATGSPVLNVDGQIAGYVSAAGDTAWSIGDRFCTESVFLAGYNKIGAGYGEHVLGVGEELILRPDPTAEYIPTHSQ